MKKYCWICEHINISSGWGGSEITPGSPSELNCGLGHWDLFDGGMYSGDAIKRKECLEYAETCEDLSVGKWIDFPMEVLKEKDQK